MPKIFYKITNKKERHNGYQYQTGLNKLNGKFDNNKKHSCVAGGLYFTDAKNIMSYLDYGINLREVYLPNDKGFKCVKDPDDDDDGDKWRANMIILGKKYDLAHVKTIKMLVKNGASLKKHIDNLMEWATENKKKDLVIYLIKKMISNPKILNNWFADESIIGQIRKLDRTQTKKIKKIAAKIIKKYN